MLFEAWGTCAPVSLPRSEIPLPLSREIRPPSSRETRRVEAHARNVPLNVARKTYPALRCRR